MQNKVKDMDEIKRLRRRHDFLLNFLLGDGYELKEWPPNKRYENWLRDTFQLLAPIHRDDMIAHYLENEKRTRQQAQNIFHGRNALAAVLASDCTGLVDVLKELCVEREA